MIATYNEIENLPKLVEAILQAVPDTDILVIDDNSPDGTGKWCDAQGAIDPRIRCLHRAGKLGLGTATIAGMKFGVEQGYCFLLNMDADFSHHPRYLPDLLSGMEPAGSPVVDCMIGSRYIPGGGVEGWPWKRRVMSWGVNLCSRWLLGLKPRDCSGAFRCYRTEILARLGFDRIRSRGYSIQEEILWRLKRAGARFGETPIVFVDRRQGSSKISLRESLTSMWVLLRLGISNFIGAGG
jgi:dolichol-phosphate mannosyltransferase